MPRVNGIYSLPPIYRAENGTTIMPAQHNVPLEDVASALTQSLPRNGSAAMTNNLPMGGRKITNLAAGEAASDAARMDQLPEEMSEYLKSVSALPLTPNRLPYALTATTAAVAVFTPYARTFTATEDAAAARTVLGLGPLATQATSGTGSSANYLRGDGAWTVPPTMGVGQTLQDVTTTRLVGTTYTNSTGRSIYVYVSGTAPSGATSNLEIGGIQLPMSDNSGVINFLVPPGATYRLTAPFIRTKWVELR